MQNARRNFTTGNEKDPYGMHLRGAGRYRNEVLLPFARLRHRSKGVSNAFRDRGVVSWIDQGDLDQLCAYLRISLLNRLLGILGMLGRVRGGKQDNFFARPCGKQRKNGARLLVLGERTLCIGILEPRKCEQRSHAIVGQLAAAFVLRARRQPREAKSRNKKSRITLTALCLCEAPRPLAKVLCRRQRPASPTRARFSSTPPYHALAPFFTIPPSGDYVATVRSPCGIRASP